MDAKNALYTMERMLYYVKNIDKHLEIMAARQSELDKEIIDLQHELRLSPMSASDLVRHAIEERRVLRELAVVKDEIKMLWKVQGFADDTYGIKSALTGCVQAMNDLRKSQETRVYTPRVRQGLKCAGRHMCQ